MNRMPVVEFSPVDWVIQNNLIKINGTTSSPIYPEWPIFYMVVQMDEETQSELATIFWENRDKARLKKEELQRKLVELKNEYSRIEEEIKELESKAV